MKKQKENSHEGVTWSEMGKQNVQAEKVYSASSLQKHNLKLPQFRFRAKLQNIFIFVLFNKCVYTL